MKRIDELGISPMPWVYSKSIGAILSDAHGVVYDELMLANEARLIAAAPELYEALREAVIEMCHDCPSCDYADGEYRCNEDADKCFVNKWREVLAKASGEEAK